MVKNSGGQSVYRILGIMSGSSLDGIDLAYCMFTTGGKRWIYRIEQAYTIPFNDELNHQLKNPHILSAEEMVHLDIKLGRFIGEAAMQLIQNCGLEKADYIASHGHTLFHNPSKLYTTQIGNGAIMAALTKIPVIADFRSLYVCLGGQGAPLVPIGDEYLFPEYDFCLNLGGFANISFKETGIRRGYDICPVNKAIGWLVSGMNKSMDKDGKMAARGTINKALLDQLNQLDYYNAVPPKSLGGDWLNKHFIKVLEDFQNISLYDRLRTVYEHIAVQIKKASEKRPAGTMLVTGGGAYNQFLMDRIRQTNANRIIMPENTLVDFKEALIFALMGLLRSKNMINCLASVTGASQDSSGGIIYSLYG